MLHFEAVYFVTFILHATAQRNSNEKEYNELVGEFLVLFHGFFYLQTRSFVIHCAMERNSM